MPTYQYRCTECGSDLEAVQKFTDPALTVCPSCGGSLRKVFNAVGVVFKGSGFYRTDSRAAKGGPNGSAEKSESTTSDKSGDGEKSGSGEKSGDAPKKTDATKTSGDGAPGSSTKSASGATKQPAGSGSSTTGKS